MSKDVLFLIPARGGSTRVKKKNLRLLGRKPLVAHVIANALHTNLGDVVVSTDDSEIADIAKSKGASVPFLRPSEMSDAHSPSVWTILHALQWLRENKKDVPEFVAFCPPTNPFLKGDSIVGMFNLIKKSPKYNSVVSIVEPKSHPFKIVRRDPDGRIHPGAIEIEGKSILNVERSQDYPKVWEGSPACRMTRTKYFLDLLNKSPRVLDHTGKTYDPDACLGFEISALESIDIDNELDFAVAQAVLEKTNP